MSCCSRLPPWLCMSATPDTQHGPPEQTDVESGIYRLGTDVEGGHLAGN